MGLDLGQIDTQIRELLGDYQSTTFTENDIYEAVNWGQNIIIRLKGFKRATRLYTMNSYPTGVLPSNLLVVRRMLLVVPTPPLVYGVDSSDTLDVVMRVLDESSVELEDAVNELWLNTRPTFIPRRWVPLGNQEFSLVPPLGPTSGVTATWAVRVHYSQMATPMLLPADPVDPSIPDYYHDSLRYVASAYLVEKDTDLKSMQLRDSLLKSFNAHLSPGVDPLATHEATT
jgi:hypothetical protein